MAKLIRYILTGMVATCVDFGLFALLVKGAHWPWFMSSCLSFTLSILVGYGISVRIVFTSGARFPWHEELALIFLISGIGLTINQGLLFILVHAGADPLLAKVVASMFVVTWNFATRSRFVFAPRD